MTAVRDRIRSRAPQWAAAAGLGFKIFALRSRGQIGAVGNVYASIYLWLDPAAARDFLCDGFAAVIEAFGRPNIETMLPLAVRIGNAEEARFLTRRDVLLGPDEDLRHVRAAEAENVADAATRLGFAAAMSAIDPATWSLTRYTLSRDPIDAPGGLVYEIAHLARPGWSALAAEETDPCR